MKKSSPEDNVSDGERWGGIYVVLVFSGLFIYSAASHFFDSDTPPALEDIQVDTLENMDSLNQLKSMVLSDIDAESEQSFYISKNHIGRRVYYKDEGFWGSRRPGFDGFEGEKLKNALEEVKITPERYQEYLSVLQLLEAKWVGYEPKTKRLKNIFPSRVEVVLSSDFLACDTKAIINTDNVIPESSYEETKSYEVLPLSSGWYLGRRCFY